MTEEQLRNVAADQMAQGFITEILLSRYFKAHPPEIWDELAELFVQAGTKTEHFTGIIESDEEAEVFADVVVKMHGALRGYLDRSLLRARASTEAAG